jgi:hypothetical protein
MHAKYADLVVQENTHLIKINLNEIFCSSITGFAFRKCSRIICYDRTGKYMAGSIEL